MEVKTLLDRMYSYAMKNAIPIMEEDGLSYLQMYFQQHGITSLLEIGTAIGYSSIALAYGAPCLKRIVTLEIDAERHKLALENISQANLDCDIEALLCDGREFVTDEKFDAVLLDGPKASLQQLLERFEKNLNPHGHMIIDDVYFHGFLDHPEVIRTRRLRLMVRKMTKFKEDFMNNPDYEVNYLPIGDGILTGKRKR